MRLRSQTGFAALETLDDNMDISRAWNHIRENVDPSTTENPGYF